MITTTALGQRDKLFLSDFEANIRAFRKQFGDQQRLLDSRSENKLALVTDVQEFFKRRSELDMEYGKNLGRLCERFQEKAKQRATYGFSNKDRASYVNLWSKLLVDANFKAKTATTLSEIYSKNIVTRLTELAEDVQRIAKSVKETHLLLEGEIKKQIGVLQSDMRRYFTKHNDYTTSKSKFDTSGGNMKLQTETPTKRGSEKRLKQLEKDYDEKRSRLHLCQEKAITSRNEYILSLDAVQSILNKYYNHDLGDIMMKYDHNFHNSFSSTLQTFIGAEVRMASALRQATDSLTQSVAAIDVEEDIKMFFEDNEESFIPDMKKLMYLPALHDDVNSITADEHLEKSLYEKQRQLSKEISNLQNELTSIQVQIDNRNKGLETTYQSFNEEMNGFYHIDMTLAKICSATTCSVSVPTPQEQVPAVPQQLKVDKEEWENGLLNKFKEKIMSENLLHQKQAQLDVLTKALGEISSDACGDSGNLRSVKLFGTSLKYQLDETGRQIPDIVESCAKYIAKLGSTKEGIFRKPGAAQEISEMKVAFDEGRDPLAGLNHWKDMNAVASVFRAYFRELEEPLFPKTYNQEYLRVTSLTKPEEQIAESKILLKKIPEWNVVVIKYMLKFLNFISQHSTQNRMNSTNLAVVFGPTLFRIADVGSIQLTIENQQREMERQEQINSLVDILISHFTEIFPDEPMEGDFEDPCHPHIDSEHEESGNENEEDSEDDLTDSDESDRYTTEAIALHDFTARSDKEISFNKGDKIKIFTKSPASTPLWWDAKVGEEYGYVPVSYTKIIENSDNGKGESDARSPSPVATAAADKLFAVGLQREDSGYSGLYPRSSTFSIHQDDRKKNMEALKFMSLKGRPSSK